ncbi:UNVERIFIED_CONTAM: hypothetical protein NCL1_20356 [Trichonephila clavipes]
MASCRCVQNNEDITTHRNPMWDILQWNARKGKNLKFNSSQHKMKLDASRSAAVASASAGDLLGGDAIASADAFGNGGASAVADAYDDNYYYDGYDGGKY